MHAIALNSSGRTTDALRVIEVAAKHWPGDRDILVAAVTLHRDAGHRDAARVAAARLLAAFPDDPDAQALGASLQ